jgi:hypothetical protein
VEKNDSFGRKNARSAGPRSEESTVRGVHGRIAFLSGPSGISDFQQNCFRLELDYEFKDCNFLFLFLLFPFLFIARFGQPLGQIALEGLSTQVCMQAKLPEGLSKVLEGLSKLLEGLSKLPEGLSTSARGVVKIARGVVKKCSRGCQQVLEGLSKLLEGLSTSARGVVKKMLLLEGLSKFARGVVIAASSGKSSSQSH